MAVIISTSFEDYANGVAPNEDASLISHGWQPAFGSIGVVSTGARTGTKCVDVPNGGGAMQWDTLVGGRHVTIGYSCKVDGTGGSDGPPLIGPNLQIASSLGSDGITRWPIQFVANGSTDVQLYIFGVLVTTVPAVVVYDQYQTWRLEVLLSTVNEAGTDVNADGCLNVYLDGAPIINLSGQRIAVTSEQWLTGVNYWDQLYYDIGCGQIDDVEGNTDAVVCGGSPPGPGPTPPPNDSTPCCGSKPDPNDPTGPSPGDPPVFPPLQPWDRECEGGGIVPTAADVVDQETWTL